jgi:hypothetical protein
MKREREREDRGRENREVGRGSESKKSWGRERKKEVRWKRLGEKEREGATEEREKGMRLMERGGREKRELSPWVNPTTLFLRKTDTFFHFLLLSLLVL